MGVENGPDMEKITAQEVGGNPESNENEFSEVVNKAGETAAALRSEIDEADPDKINSPAFQEKLGRLGEMLKSLAQGIKKGLKDEAELAKFIFYEVPIVGPKDAIVGKVEDLMDWVKYNRHLNYK